MCGIAGLWSARGLGADELTELSRAMADSLVHRGPDGSGVWVDERSGVGFGHRRLAIVDLSEAGHQPMVSGSGRWVVVLNGEIYDHLDMRRSLEAHGVTLRGTSDTEAFLETVDREGVRAAVEGCAAMLAVALWDRRERELWLVRDRLGEKPLYYGRVGGDFVFASELKAFRTHPAFDGDVDRRALSEYLRLGYVPGDLCIHPGVHKLQPGRLLRLRAADAEPAIETYWSLEQVAEEGEVRPFEGDFDRAVDAVETALDRALAGQMLADVPLGAFLSGGVDSSVVVALMQRRASRPVRTFTVGFDDARFDEAPHARAVAEHLGTDHTELHLTAADALEFVPSVPRIWDEPMADSSQIPTALIARLTRQHVTVALSADGGDELFAGYNTYGWVRKGWRALSRVPRPVRALGKAVTGRIAGPMADRGLIPGRHAHRIHRAADLLDARTSDELFRRLGWQWATPPLLGATPPRRDIRLGDRPRDPLTRMQLMDASRYMPDDILVKVDRAAMASSLETRAPLLDHRLVELAFRIPPELRFREGMTKAPLRAVLYRHVPRELVERPKRGFAVPLADWLRGPLREWAEELLEPGRLRDSGLDPVPIRRRWSEHVSEARDWKAPLWTVLTHQAWRETVRP